MMQLILLQDNGDQTSVHYTKRSSSTFQKYYQIENNAIVTLCVGIPIKIHLQHVAGTQYLCITPRTVSMCLCMSSAQSMIRCDLHRCRLMSLLYVIDIQPKHLNLTLPQHKTAHSRSCSSHKISTRLCIIFSQFCLGYTNICLQVHKCLCRK